ncbi:unnamed protein product [Camellia sinensis]
MTVDSSLIDAEITLLDAAGAVTAISDNEYNGGGRGGGTPMIRSNFVAKKTVGDVWKEIVAGRRELRECKKEAPDEVTTLEEFPAKAEVVVEDVKVRLVPPLGERLSGGFLAFDPMPLSRFPSQQSVDSFEGFGNGVEVIGGRGKRRAVLELLDRAAQQRQRRMIKNRESAARSTYFCNAERTKERFKKLIEKVVPVVEKRKPPCVLWRVDSMNYISTDVCSLPPVMVPATKKIQVMKIAVIEDWVGF